jgi:hypothetical protein
MTRSRARCPGPRSRSMLDNDLVDDMLGTADLVAAKIPVVLR